MIVLITWNTRHTSTVCDTDLFPHPHGFYITARWLMMRHVVFYKMFITTHTVSHANPMLGCLSEEGTNNYVMVKRLKPKKVTIKQKKTFKGPYHGPFSPSSSGTNNTVCGRSIVTAKPQLSNNAGYIHSKVQKPELYCKSVKLLTLIWMC